MIGTKGVSPVVAVVLLIAIAVIAAIGVWYWVSVFTGKPPTGGQQQVAFSIEDCKVGVVTSIHPGLWNGSSIKVRVTGGLRLATNASVYNQSSGARVGVINFGQTPLNPKDVGWVSIHNATGSMINITGTNAIIDPNYPNYIFTCS
jgi:flagellin-like protein